MIGGRQIEAAPCFFCCVGLVQMFKCHGVLERSTHGIVLKYGVLRSCLILNTICTSMYKYVCTRQYHGRPTIL